MKVYAKKIYYEQDLYQYPDENLHYGLFPVDEKHIAPYRLNPKLVYSKGGFEKWKFEVQEYCCEPMEEAIGAERITFIGVWQNVNVSIACACWPIQSMRINFCLFCGKKIKIEEKG